MAHPYLFTAALLVVWLIGWFLSLAAGLRWAEIVDDADRFSLQMAAPLWPVVGPVLATAKVVLLASAGMQRLIVRLGWTKPREPR